MHRPVYLAAYHIPSDAPWIVIKVVKCAEIYIELCALLRLSNTGVHQLILPAEHHRCTSPIERIIYRSINSIQLHKWKTLPPSLLVSVPLTGFPRPRGAAGYAGDSEVDPCRRKDHWADEHKLCQGLLK